MRIALLTTCLILLASLSASANSADIMWRCPTCAADGVISYTVRVGLTSGGDYNIKTQYYTNVEPDSDGVVTVPFDFTGLPPATYYEVITNFNGDMDSAPSPVERTIIVPSPVEQLLPSAMLALVWMRGWA
jgi:hypothetical protein